MDEFIIDEEYVLKRNTINSELWDTYRHGKLLSKSAEKLYRFYPLNLYSIDGLFRSYFHLSNPGDFNDPFDCNVNLIEDVDDLSHMKTVKRNNFGNLGICSFSETIDNHLMWAHYTNNYYGFALEFDGDKIDMKQREGHLLRHTLTRVIYPKEPIKIKKDYPFASHYVLTTKFKHWEYEKEWRIITELGNDERCLEYFPKCVKAIYIGHKIVDNDINLYKLLLELHEMKFPDIPISVVYPHPTDLKLEFEKVLN
ncbi:DUF2971 domain-containing protein [Flavobacterium sp. WV_118_3]|uniref:DUF2971 domain-containing protein n=1 Tax=Flavobacterium sp. WV_118_3 TaxID=3151764 RepID=UPI00321B3497